MDLPRQLVAHTVPGLRMGDLFASLILSSVTGACPISSNTFEEPVTVAEKRFIRKA